MPCSRAIMPSMALSAMRKNKVTGNSRKGQRDWGRSASQAPWARLKPSAAKVTPLAVTPALAKPSAWGRSSAWMRGLRS